MRMLKLDRDYIQAEISALTALIASLPEHDYLGRSSLEARRKRRYIGRTPEQLYPDREDLRDFHEKLPGGWLVATNLNNDCKRKIIDLATETAGLRPREDIKPPSATNRSGGALLSHASAAPSLDGTSFRMDRCRFA